MQTDRQNGSRSKSESAGQSPSTINYTCTCRKNENEIRIQARKPRAHHHPQRKHRRRKAKRVRGKDTSYPSCPQHSANRTEPARCRKRLQYSGTVYRIPQRQPLFRVVAQKKRIITMTFLPFTEPAIPQRNCYPPPL